MKFSDLGLTRSILDALKKQGYQTPTPIQEQAIPAALAGRDVLGCARTGTGKTCAFAAPILQRLAAQQKKGRPIRALILTPTRELAIQIQECFAAYGANLPLKSVVIFGGVGQNPQVEAIQAGCDILIATPGRLQDLHDQGFVDVSRLEIFVLDEADRMLDMGFIHDVKKILKWLPQQKQTLFFSATMPEEIAQLVDSLLHDPVKIAVDPVSSPVEVIAQSIYFVDKGNKTKLLIHLLEEKHISSALVFTRTKHGANRVAQDLTRAKISAAAIHGNKSQTARQAALAGFKEGTLRVLVATDIAARGLDIEDLSFVFNYNLPEVPETYVHRIGRTARAGKEGSAISFCDFSEKDLLRDIEKLIGRSVPVVKEHPFPMQVLEAAVKDKHGRTVNAEDAEARAAAKAKKQAEKKKEAAAPLPEQSAEKASSGAEKKKAKKSKSKKDKQSVPAAEDFGLVKLPEKREYKRPERKPYSALDDLAPVLPEPAEAPQGAYGAKRTGRLRNTFFTPEEQQRYSGECEPFMDATSRLFATRKAIPEKYQEPKREKLKEGKKPAPQSEEKKGKKKGKMKAKNQNAKTESAGTPAAQKRLLKPVKQKKKKSADRPPRSQRSMFGAHHKDSTEQKSLMKPFYLSDD